MSQPRIKILGIEKYTIANHNEEHMVIRTPLADKFRTGDIFYCVPYHICPTVDRHDIVYVVDKHSVTGTWNVEARKRIITI
jgi:D-serine deaminase-like pyridoxal phosphate-dependent protein